MNELSNINADLWKTQDCYEIGLKALLNDLEMKQILKSFSDDFVFTNEMVKESQSEADALLKRCKLLKRHDQLMKDINTEFSAIQQSEALNEFDAVAEITKFKERQGSVKEEEENLSGRDVDRGIYLLYCSVKEKIAELRGPEVGSTAGGAEGGGEEEEERMECESAAGMEGGDSLVMTQTVISNKDPIQPSKTITNPVRSKICRHYYEASTIYEHITTYRAHHNRKDPKCPHIGCNTPLKESELESCDNPWI